MPSKTALMTRSLSLSDIEVTPVGAIVKFCLVIVNTQAGTRIVSVLGLEDSCVVLGRSE